RALAQRGMFVWHDQRRIEIELRAEAVADRAGAVRIVEREKSGFDLGYGKAGDRAGEFRRHQEPLRLAVLLYVREFGDDEAVGEIERGLDRIRQAVADVGPDRDAVDDDLDVVL